MIPAIVGIESIHHDGKPELGPRALADRVQLGLAEVAAVDGILSVLRILQLVGVDLQMPRAERPSQLARRALFIRGDRRRDRGQGDCSVAQLVHRHLENERRIDAPRKRDERRAPRSQRSPERLHSEARSLAELFDSGGAQHGRVLNPKTRRPPDLIGPGGRRRSNYSAAPQLLRLPAAFFTRAERAAGRAVRMSLLVRAFFTGFAFIRLPVMILSSSGVTQPRSRTAWKIFNPPSSTVSLSEWT